MTKADYEFLGRHFISFHWFRIKSKFKNRISNFKDNVIAWLSFRPF